MQIRPEFAFGPLPEGQNQFPLPFPEFDEILGPLCQLPGPDGTPPAPGTWTGSGFNVIWRPNSQGNDHFLELNLTKETLEFEIIHGAIPNRGLLQNDISMFGVHYLQQIMDANLNAGLHLEPGVWAVVPATTNPQEQPTVVRMGSVPHGTVILAQGTATVIPGPPQIPAVDITPFTIGNPAKKIPFAESNLEISSQFRSPATQIAGITQAMLDNPNSLLTAAINGQQIRQTIVLDVASDSTPVPGGGTANTAFLQGSASGAPNANAAVVRSTFWIETVAGNPQDFLQLQYTQTVLLNFNGLSWPHITVATLRKQVQQS
jgi:hypothetical protein